MIAFLLANPVIGRFLAGLGLLLALAALCAGMANHLEAEGAAKEKAAAAQAAASATESATKETARRIQAQQEIVDDAQSKLAVARAAAGAADSRARGLREQLAAIRGRAASDPAAACDCSRERGRSALLADMLGQAWDFAAGAGAEADELRVAGAACERAYGTLTP